MSNIYSTYILLIYENLSLPERKNFHIQKIIIPNVKPPKNRYFPFNEECIEPTSRNCNLIRWYFCLPRKNFNFHFFANKQRLPYTPEILPFYRNSKQFTELDRLRMTWNFSNFRQTRFLPSPSLKESSSSIKDLARVEKERF